MSSYDNLSTLSGYYYPSHFTDKEAEAQSRQITCPMGTELRFKLGEGGSRIHIPNHYAKVPITFILYFSKYYS